MALQSVDGKVNESAGIGPLALAAFDSMDAAVFITDIGGAIEWVNPGFSRLTEWPADEAIGKTPAILHPGFADQGHAAPFWTAFGNGSSVRTHVVNRTRSGALYAAAQRVTAINGPDGTPQHFLTIQEHSSGDELAADQLPVALVAMDAAGRICLANYAAGALLGWDSLSLFRESFVDTVVPEDARAEAQTVLDQVLCGELWQGELTAVRADSSRLTIKVQMAPQYDRSGAVVGLIAAVIDASEEVRLRETLAHTARIEAAGRFAASLAHDFNNVLTAVILHANLAAAQTDDEHPVKADLKQIEKEAERATALIRQLMVFSRRHVVQRTSLGLNDLVRDLEPLLGHLVREDIRLDFQFGAGMEPIWADASEVEQVLVNLVVNARDAMPAGGTIVIRTSVDTRLRTQRFGVIEVSDTGTGIAPEIRDHIFDPFFTTKGERGTGLGLATVHGIATHSGGSVTVESEPGRGATFRVAFPMARHAIAGEAGALTGETVTGNLSGRTALVVDDDEGVRKIVQRMLSAHGATVIAAGTPDEALRMLQERREALDLVVTDIVMPGMSGPELADVLRRAGMAGPVVYITGYAAELGAEVRGVSDSQLLAKPFTSGQLLEVAERVLEDWRVRNGTDSKAVVALPLEPDTLLRIELPTLDRGDGSESGDLESVAVLRRRIGELEAERRRHLETEEVLAEGLSVYRTILESANDAIFIADAETGQLLDANPAAERLVGRSRSDIVQMNQKELHPPSDADQEREKFRRVGEVGSGIAADVFVVNAEGSAIPVEVSANVFVVDGRRLMLGIFRDLRDRVRAENER